MPVFYIFGNFLFILQISHAKTFKMRYIMSLYKPFWKYESWFCSEVSKLTLSNYAWNHAFSGRKKISQPMIYHSFWYNYVLDTLSTSTWPSDPQFCQRHICTWLKNDQKWSFIRCKFSKLFKHFKMIIRILVLWKIFMWMTTEWS